MPEGVTLLTTYEAARALGVDIRAVQRWLKEKKLRGGMLPMGKRWRVSAAHVRELRREMGIDGDRGTTC
jgi:excisionase family DNA binding protein